jgi:transcriptional regulator with XRE-family HTH domain
MTAALDELRWVRELATSGEARARREAAHLRVAEVAREIGVWPSTLSRWERGLRLPRPEPAARWAAFLRGLG